MFRGSGGFLIKGSRSAICALANDSSLPAFVLEGLFFATDASLLTLLLYCVSLNHLKPIPAHNEALHLFLISNFSCSEDFVRL